MLGVTAPGRTRQLYWYTVNGVQYSWCTDFFCSKLLLAACNPFRQHHKAGGKKTGDPFYTDQGEWDVSRIPLIKPYEIQRLKGSSEWLMSLETAVIDVSITNVKEVNVYEGIITVHSGTTNLPGIPPPNEAWFVIIPEKHIEKGFDKLAAFRQYLSSVNEKAPATFHKVDDVLAKFVKDGTTYWPAVQP